MGSFDRYFWGWKKKDFSDASLQYAVILAVRYAEYRQQTSQLPPLLDATIDFCGSIQHQDGSFDQSYPFERHPSVFYDLLPALLYVYQSPYIGSPQKTKLEQILEKGLKFSLNIDETYAAISNHYAQYAYDLYFYNSLFNHEKAKQKADLYMQRLLSLFHKEEGWFEEYAGPDVGYQTRTLCYLTQCARLLSSGELWNVAKTAANFLNEMLMPDGSAHPMLGSRSTALIYPSGFEQIAKEYPEFSSLAERVRYGWENGRVPLPSALDFDNAIRLAEDAHLANEVMMSSNRENNRKIELPIEAGNQENKTHFARTVYPLAGIYSWKNPNVAVFLAAKLGGSLAVYQKKGDEWSLIHEDSGYLVKDDRKNIRWLTRMPDNGSIIEETSDSIKLKVDFLESLHDELSPLRMILLRLLNLTFLRWQMISDVFKKAVVKRLMNRRVKSELHLERIITLNPHSLEILDKIHPPQALEERQDLALFACRRVSGTHMASARYFQEQELLQLPLDWVFSDSDKSVTDFKRKIEF